MVTLPVLGQDDSDLVGTLNVKAVEQFAGGEFKGCSLNFQVATKDFAYRKGNLVVIDGSYNINLVKRANKTTAGILLKVGVLEMGKPKPEAPTFAYLKTSKASTVKSVLSNEVSESPGYQIFVLSLDSPGVSVLTGMLDDGEVDIGFNRKVGGSDVLAKIDLRVVESKFNSKGLERIRSDSVLTTLTSCVLKSFEALKQ